jgi:hypothetical protein
MAKEVGALFGTIGEANSVKRSGRVRRAIGVGLAIPLIAVALQACGGDDDDPTATSAPVTTDAPTTAPVDASPVASPASVEAGASPVTNLTGDLGQGTADAPSGGGSAPTSETLPEAPPTT